MNKAQITYAIQRVDTSLKSKISAVEEKYTVKKKALTVTDVYKAIKEGAVKVNKGYETTKIDSYIDLDDVFDLSPLGYRDVVDTKKSAPEIAKLKKEAESIKDKLILGDCQEALKLIESFCN